MTSPVPEAALLAFLRRTYGADASLDDAWQVTGDEEVRERRVCARNVVSGAAPRVMLAVCGIHAVDSHAMPGYVDLHLLDARTAELAVTATLRRHETGSAGQPGEVTAVQLGPAVHGFATDSAFVGQGFVLGTRTLLMPEGDTFVPVAQFRTALSNFGVAHGGRGDVESDAPGLDLKFHMDVDASASGPMYPLRVVEEGVDRGERVRRTYTVPFDPTTRRYAVPDALMRKR